MPTNGDEPQSWETPSAAKTRTPNVLRLPRWITFSCFFWLPLLASTSVAYRTVAQAPPAPAPPAQAAPSPVAPSVQQPTAKPAPKRNPDEFPPNPLEITTPDPLLPQTAGQRPLSEAERKQLALALDALDQQAAEKLKQHDRVGAFDLWYRELRLRRSLGVLEEVKALGRVGEIAWKENLAPDVRWITKRLDAILANNQLPVAATSSTSNSASQTASTPSSPATISSSERASRITVLEALGLAYQQIRLPQTAASVYQQILTDARQHRDEKKVDATLITLGQLYLNWFNYPNAASSYQELANRAKSTRRSRQRNHLPDATSLRLRTGKAASTCDRR